MAEEPGLAPTGAKKTTDPLPARLKALNDMTKAMLKLDEDDRAWVLKRLAEVL